MNSKSNTNPDENIILRCKKWLIITHVILIVLLTIYAYWFLDVNSITSFGFWLIVLTTAFLIIISIVPKIIVVIPINTMKGDVARHYQSFITNMTIGFSSVIGIGIALIWSQPAINYRNMVTSSLVVVAIYFILVMYLKFYYPLNLRIDK